MYSRRQNTFVITIILGFAQMTNIVTAFTSPPLQNIKSVHVTNLNQQNRNNQNNQPESPSFPNPFRVVTDMFQNFDDQVDDFFNKRMGQGEIFYGKRKYNPSGSVDGDYNGLGISDFQKIEATKEWLEEKKFRKEMEELRRAKETK